VSERRAFLTGTTGFVGGHVARALCAGGWAVRALTRAPDRIAAAGLGDLPLEAVVGDLSVASAAPLRGAARGSQAIVHVAGLVKARSLEEYRDVNARGTERLLAAAGESAPEALFLLVSSQAAAGPADAGRPVVESDAARPVSWYGRSKLEAEQAVAQSWRGPWVVVRPGVV
jgi:nucleoside-diphosphate-sugar epimerase